jgi:hypothetical protein
MHVGGGCMLYATNLSPNAKHNVAMEWTKVSRMGQKCILPFGWDNFVPALRASQSTNGGRGIDIYIIEE